MSSTRYIWRMADSAQTEALRPVSTVDALADALREQILDGRLPPGTALREADIAGRFQVSRHTVRTALQALTHDGIVRHAANRGAFVPDLTAEDIADLFRLRAVLEADAVNHLATGLADLSGVRTALEALQELPANAEWGAVRDADLAFHKALIDSLGSERVGRTYASLMVELRLCLLRIRPQFEDHARIAGQHANLLRAIETRDGPGASEVLRDHLDETLGDIVDALAESAHASR